MGKSLLTKVGKGIKYGDVSNIAVRNILTEISTQLFGNITDEDIRESLNFFGWKCPYTGRDLKPDIESGVNSYVLDHIVPQNKESCGLNAKGNLVLVDKIANQKKSASTVEDFIRKNTEVIKDDSKTREERIEKIHEFQRINKYDPTAFQSIISPMLLNWYSTVQENQKKQISEIVKMIPDDIKNAPPREKINTAKAQTSAVASSSYALIGPEKIGTIVKEKLIPCLETGGATAEEIKAYLTVNGSKEAFGLSGFPLLSKIRSSKEECRRYYKDAIIIRGEIYYITSQWFEKQIEHMKKWLDEH